MSYADWKEWIDDQTINAALVNGAGRELDDCVIGIGADGSGSGPLYIDGNTLKSYTFCGLVNGYLGNMDASANLGDGSVGVNYIHLAYKETSDAGVEGRAPGSISFIAFTLVPHTTTDTPSGYQGSMVLGYATSDGAGSWSLLTSYELPIKFVRKISVPDIEGDRWKPIADFTAAPPSKDTAGNDVSDWVANTAYNLGDFVKPTSMLDHIYECVTAGTSHAANEPVWGTTVGEDTNDNTAVWRCRGLNIILTTKDLTDTVIEGVPIKYAYDGTMYYGIVLAVTSTQIRIAGPPLLGTDNITALHYGRSDGIVQLDFFVAGAYGNGVDNSLLWNDENRKYRWLNSNGYAVLIRAGHKTDDTTVNPKINLRTSKGVNLSLDDTGNGLQMTTISYQNDNPSPVAIKSSIYLLSRNDYIEIDCSVAGGTGDASDLFVSLIVVLE